MFKKLLISTILVVAMLIIVGSVIAITNGRPDGDDHPYVGILLFEEHDPDTGELVDAWLCSGTLIEPTVVLTAGHCNLRGGSSANMV